MIFMQFPAVSKAMSLGVPMSLDVPMSERCSDIGTYSGGSEGRKKASVVHGVLTLISCSRWVGNDPRKKIGGDGKLFRAF